MAASGLVLSSREDKLERTDALLLVIVTADVLL
jgi:hypothetical protein